MFEEIMYTTNGLYYDVHLFHQSHIVVHESTQFNVTCLLLQPYLIETHTIRVDKGKDFLKMYTETEIILHFFLIILLIGESLTFSQH